MSEDERHEGDVLFVRRLLLAILVLGVTWIFWSLRFVLVLAFGAILFAVVLDAAAGFLAQRLRVPERFALVTALVLVIGGTAASLWFFGAEVAGSAEGIAQALPDAIAQGRQFAAQWGLGGWVDGWLAEFRRGSGVGGSIGQVLMSVGDSFTNLVLVVFGGIFIALNPGIYRTGLIKLIPPSARSNAATALDDSRNALRLWLKGRLLAMALVGVLTGAGLWLIGIPSWLALGLLATLLEFIPFFGPIIAAVPAVLLALLVSPGDAALVVVLFLVVQQLEGNVISPLIQHRAVELPPALLLFALLAFGLLFGLVGVLLAEPLTVALFVLVKRLYVREALGTRTPIPGEATGGGP